MTKEIEDFLEAGYRAAFGVGREEAHTQGVCVNCKKPPTFYSEAGRREYSISGICEPCFDGLFAEEGEEDG